MKALSRFALLTPALALLAQDAAAQFAPATNVPTGTQPDTVATGDLNGDGIADLAITTDAPDKVSIHFGTGGGAFAAPVNVFLAGGSGPAAILAVNVDGDTDIDLVVTLKNINAVQVLFNSGTGTFTPGPTVAVGMRPQRMAAANLDGDMDIDLVTSNRDSANASVLLNDGNGAFSAGPTLAVPGEPRGIVAADLSGDMLADIAVAEHDNERVFLFTNQGGATFGAGTILSLGVFRPDGLATGNIDGDADLDLIAATSNNNLEWISVLTNTGAGFTGPVSYQTLGLNSSEVVTGDFNLDGAVDVAVSNSNSANVSVLLNSGAGTFGAATLHAVGTTPDRMTGADLDGNGSMDLVTANRDSNSASVLLNMNAGTVGTPFCFGVGCPCGNDSATTGCTNSTGGGALLTATGSLSVAADALVLTTTGCPPDNTGLYFMGASTFAPVFVGDGLGCTGGLFRFFPSVVTPTGEFTLSSPVANALPGQIVAGDTRHFQSWTRDVLCGPPPAPCPSPCGMNSNVSNGLTVTFVP